MKKLISALLALALMLALSPPGHADYDPKVDYLSIMLHAAEVGDIEAGRAAAICRNEQIDIELTGETKLDFDELFLLAKIICAEAGSPQLGDDWRMSCSTASHHRSFRTASMTSCTSRGSIRRSIPLNLRTCSCRRRSALTPRGGCSRASA